ncbi:hypothetical protein BCV69DRAFT_257516, partial [Microstroma glucosiphilum]
MAASYSTFHNEDDDGGREPRDQAGPSSARPHTQTEETLNQWLSSPLVAAPRSRSLPRNGQAEHPSSHLWSHLRTSVNATSALRSAKTDREARRRNRRAAAESDASAGWVDSEGLGDFLPGSGRRRARNSRRESTNAESDAAKKAEEGPMRSWTPLAHYWQGQPAGKARRSVYGTPGESQSVAAGESGIHAAGSSISQTVNMSAPVVMEEPESLIDGNPAHIPRGENPLAYTDTKDLLDSESDSDSDSEDEEKETEGQPAGPRIHLLGGNRTGSATAGSATLSRLWSSTYSKLSHPSPLTKGVTKCVVAYFLASLFTYSPQISTFMAHLLPSHDHDDLVPFGNLHMIATVAVYFHPARTFGSMIEADIFAMGAFLFSMSLTFVSMLAAVKLHDLGHPHLSNLISVFVFLAGGMALVGYAKVKMGKPTFNTACSLIYVSTFTVVVKEGAVHLGEFETDKVWQVTLVIFAGTLVANLVCFTVWPQSATTNLHNDVSRVLDAYSTLLRILTRTFLLEDHANIHIRSSRVRAAIAAHHSAYTSMQKNLGEARYEAPFDPRIRGRVKLMQEAVDSLNRLGGHLQGLRSSCATQHETLEKNQREEDSSDASPSFKPFLNAIGPHMRSLVFTCSQSLQALEGATRKDATLEAFEELEADLIAAVRRFRHEQVAALKTMSTIEPTSDDASPLASMIDSARNGPTENDESIVVVFFFVFNLEELAQELTGLVKIMRLLSERAKEIRAQTWTQWLTGLFAFDRLRRAMRLPFRETHKPVPAPVTFPANQRHTPSTAHTPVARDRAQRLSYKLWSFGEFFKQRDVKFAIKTGFGCAILAAPAFMAETRPTFVEYKGQWALVSFMVVLSPTVGQSNQMSLHRIIGTIFGAVVAAAGYWLFEDNNVVLPFFGAIFSIPCFQYIVGKPHLASSGRFVLLTFNLTCLYSYNLRKTNVEVESVAFERTVAVIIGVVWATILNHLLWPNEARRELANGLSDLLFKLSWLYQCLVIAYSSEDPHLQERGRSVSRRPTAPSQLESQPLLEEYSPTIFFSTAHDSSFPTPLFQSLELHIQFQLVRLESLLAQTRHEPRLKGPFPIRQYREYLTACTDVLDKLHSMRCIISREEWRRVRQGWIVPCNVERREMVGNVLLFFHLLATSSTLKTPLPPYLPPAERSRQALLGKVRNLPLRIARRGPLSTSTTTTDTILLHSYLLAMHDLVANLEKLGVLSWEMFGVLG